MAVSKRMDFSLIKGKYNKIGKGNVRLTQSSLFLTQAIDPTKSTYDFDVLENQTQSLTSDQIRLNLNDEFVITDLGVYLYGSYNTYNAETGVFTELGKQLFTYVPYELGLENSWASPKYNIALKNVYAGTLKIAVNNIVYLEKFDTRESEVITQTQFANHDAGISDSTSPNNNFGEDGMVKFSPMITLSGAKKNDITVRLPSAVTEGVWKWTLDTDEVIYVKIDKIAVRCFGLLAQNGATFQG
jgi:hypothetical protein